MITGIVAQELQPLPRGVLKSLRSFVDDDAIFVALVGSDLDQFLFSTSVADADQIFVPDMPTMLTVEALWEAWQDSETLPTPRVTQSKQIIVSFYTAADIIFAPDIRVPGFLLPTLFVDADIILPTPLLLDPGMLRQEQSYFDPDIVLPFIIYAAQTLFPQLLNSPDVIYAPRAIAGSISPSLFVSDDVIFNFATQTVFRPPLVIDTGRPVLPATTWDGVNSGVNISSDGLTAALASSGNYRGARSTVTKSLGKFYWEITLGPSHGSMDQAAIGKENASFTQITQATVLNESLGMFNNYQVIDNGPTGNPAGNSVAGTVIGNASWYCHFGHSRGPNDGFVVEGDVLGIAVNLDDRTAWFRLNGGPWNNNQRGATVSLNQDPATGFGGFPLPNGKMGPVVTLGGAAGIGPSGNSGDSFTANFGAKAYRNPPPAGYLDWILDSPFGAPINGDSFGSAAIGLPATLNGDVAFVIVSNGNLTATHNTTNDYSGVISASTQKSGRYYFEIMIGATHGRNDSVGLMVTSLLGANPEGTFAKFASGTASANVFLFDGAIWSNAGNTNQALGAIVAGDVVGIAIDLTTQTVTQGGYIWFRKKSGAVIGNWNGAVLSSDADPATATGGLPVYGFSYSKTWTPAVGFSGAGNAVGDNVTANFGATSHAMPRPNGYSIWPIDYNNNVQVLLANTVSIDDAIIVPFIGLSIQQLFHLNPILDTDIVFPTGSFGGNLLFLPSKINDTEVIYAPGNFARFDVWSSPQIAISPDNLTATVVTQLAKAGARSSAQQIAGKFYFEVTWTGAHGSQDGAGILTEAASFADMWSGIGCVSVVGNSGIIFSNNATSGRSLGAPVSGEIIGVAIDLDTRKGWFRRNNGLWNGNATANPETGAIGVVIQSLVSFAPAVSLSSTPGNAYTMNFGSVSPFAFTPPLGFTIWPGNSVTQAPLRPALVADSESFAVPRIDPQTLTPSLLPADDAVYLLTGSGGFLTMGPTVAVADAETFFAPSVSFQLASFDGVPANVTLSNGNLTATHSSTATDSGARSTANKTTGKWYFEVTMSNIHGNFDCAGVLVPAATYTNFVSQSINCLSTFKSSGNIWGGNIYSGKTLGAIVNGDVISFAVDLTARRAWLRKNGGNWNGLALASENPNTGTGGVIIAATVAYAPAVGFGGIGTLAGDAMTANFGKTAYAFPAPTGFGNWTL